MLFTTVIACQGIADATLDMVFHNDDSYLLSGGNYRGQLVKHVHTVLILINHLLNSLELTFHASQANKYLILIFGIGCHVSPHKLTVMPMGGIRHYQYINSTGYRQEL